MCHCLLELVVFFILRVARTTDLHSSWDSDSCSVLQTLLGELHDSLRINKIHSVITSNEL